MQPELTEIAIEDQQLTSCDVSQLIRLFFKEMTVASAKNLAATVYLSFPKYDNDSRPNCVIPEIRSFIGKLHSEEPRFPFYYVDEHMLGMHVFHLACLLPLDNIVLMEDGTKMRLRMDDQDFVLQYLNGIDSFMSQLEYEELDVTTRIQSVILGLRGQ